MKRKEGKEKRQADTKIIRKNTRRRKEPERKMETKTPRNEERDRLNRSDMEQSLDPSHPHNTNTKTACEQRPATDTERKR